MPLNGSEVFVIGVGDAVADGVGVADAFGVAFGLDGAVDEGALSGRTSLA